MGAGRHAREMKEIGIKSWGGKGREREREVLRRGLRAVYIVKCHPRAKSETTRPPFERKWAKRRKGYHSHWQTNDTKHKAEATKSRRGKTQTSQYRSKASSRRTPLGQFCADLVVRDAHLWQIKLPDMDIGRVLSVFWSRGFHEQSGGGFDDNTAGTEPKLIPNEMTLVPEVQRGLGWRENPFVCRRITNLLKWVTILWLAATGGCSRKMRCPISYSLTSLSLIGNHETAQNATNGRTRHDVFFLFSFSYFLLFV